MFSACFSFQTFGEQLQKIASRTLACWCLNRVNKMGCQHQAEAEEAVELNNGRAIFVLFWMGRTFRTAICSEHGQLNRQFRWCQENSEVSSLSLVETTMGGRCACQKPDSWPSSLDDSDELHMFSQFSQRDKASFTETFLPEGIHDVRMNRRKFPCVCTCTCTPTTQTFPTGAVSLCNTDSLQPWKSKFMNILCSGCIHCCVTAIKGIGIDVTFIVLHDRCGLEFGL